MLTDPPSEIGISIDGVPMDTLQTAYFQEGVDTEISCSTSREGRPPSTIAIAIFSDAIVNYLTDNITVTPGITNQLGLILCVASNEIGSAGALLFTEIIGRLIILTSSPLVFKPTCPLRWKILP